MRESELDKKCGVCVNAGRRYRLICQWNEMEIMVLWRLSSPHHEGIFDRFPLFKKKKKISTFPAHYLQRFSHSLGWILLKEFSVSKVDGPIFAAMMIIYYLL